MATVDQVRTRRAEIEALMLKGAWNLATQNRMAARHGVDVRTVYRDAAWIRERWKEGHEQITPEEDRAQFIERLRAAQLDAAQHNAHTARGRMLRLEAQVCGHNQPVRVEVSHNVGQMSRIEQAHLLIQKAEEAKLFLSQSAPKELETIEPRVIDVE